MKKEGKQLNVTVFSGAGMSAESGIQTFRGQDGLWENHRIEDVATPEAWRSNPALVTRFYNLRRKNVINAEPNLAHRLLNDLEQKYDVQIITQNIDDLHERAGSSSVLHLHGNIRYAKSSGYNQEKEYFRIDGWELTEHDLCPEGHRLRPHVVWFGEAVPAMEKAIELLQRTDILIVIGTSLQVYPAASLVNFAANAKQKYLIDPNASEMNVPTDFRIICQEATQGIQELVKTL